MKSFNVGVGKGRQMEDQNTDAGNMAVGYMLENNLKGKGNV